MPPQISNSPASPADTPADAVVVTAGLNDGGLQLSHQAMAVDRALDGALRSHLEATAFSGKPGSVALVTPLGRLPSRTVAVAGTGSTPTPGTVRRAVAAATRKLTDHASVALAIDADRDTVAAAVEGAVLATYRFGGYRQDPLPPARSYVVLGANDEETRRAQALATAVVRARDLINEPASVLTPTEFARRGAELATAAGLEATVLDENEIAGRAMGGVIAVSKGSAEAPRVLHLKSTRSDGPLVALVGKGVTFDSGGLSLKDARGMETMKTDMGGGAAVIAASVAAAEMDLDVSLEAFVPMVENLPSGTSIKPGDVIHHYGGLTSEVLNTDAEGRLILADVLAWASERSPAAIVDVATLTGSMHIALGRSITGYFASRDELAGEIEAAAEAAGEAFWRMPLYDPYGSELESDVADMKNVGSRYGGALIAALFLRRFVDNEIPWAHLDIAGPGRSDSASDDGPKGATGVATRTLIRWLEGRSS